MGLAESIRNDMREIIPLVIVIGLAILGWLYWQSTNNSSLLTLSGTIEATEIRVGSQLGGEAKRVYVNEGDYVDAGQKLISIYSAATGVNESITSPIEGTVLERLIEVGELAAPGNTLIVVADLSALTLTVYVPEDRYGQILLGQTYPVTVDSFPDQAFSGTVRHIADQAEFTPRNVQTVEGRKSTVFAIDLALAPSGGKLKPGMPADVNFEPR